MINQILVLLGLKKTPAQQMEDALSGFTKAAEGLAVAAKAAEDEVENLKTQVAKLEERQATQAKVAEIAASKALKIKEFLG